MLISFTDNGLYCARGDFYIDPWKPVDTAVITHAHSDHARSGHGNYLCHELTLPLLRARLGVHRYQSVAWQQPVIRNGVRVSLHPAGHIIGSSQVRIEYKGECWVISGDYKTEDDGLSGCFEPIPCTHFVTESTFGLPVYKWKPQTAVFDDMRSWIEQNRKDGFSSVFYAYSLGKAQRLIDAFRKYEGLLFAHGAVLNMQAALSSAGLGFPSITRMSADIPGDIRKGSIFISPAPIEQTQVAKLIGPYRSATCSGWMQIRGNRRRGHADQGFVLSDHADWEGLIQSVKSTGAEQVFVTHGFQSVFSRYLNEHGITAHEVSTRFGEEEEFQITPEKPIQDA